MTDEEKAAAEAAAKALEGKTFTQAEVDAMLAGLKAKNVELLGETKAERAKREALEATQAEQEAERQKQAGEFRDLYEKTQADLKAEREQIAAYKGQIAKRDVDGEAASLAGSLTRDTARLSLLKEQAAKFAKHGDNGVTYEIGGVTVDREAVISKLTADYPFLVDGNGSTGGGANGGSGGAAKDISQMGDAERLDLARQGKLRKPA